MAKRNQKAFIAIIALIVFFWASLNHYLGGSSTVSTHDLLSTAALPHQPFHVRSIFGHNGAVSHQHESTHLTEEEHESNPDSTVSILLPNWEILVITPPEHSPEYSPENLNFTCLFPNNVSSPAIRSGVIQSPERQTYKCDLPRSLRRRQPFPSPELVNSGQSYYTVRNPEAPELLRWNYLVYESYTTDDDVVVFVKGVNNRQGINRPASELRCVFATNDGVLTTAVTSSLQEVFRCKKPDPTASFSSPIKISISVPEHNRPIPSVAYYSPQRRIENPDPKTLICACTMVYDVAKFLPEWVIYHAGIGVGKFFLYDNDSDDDLNPTVDLLNSQGYDVRVQPWVWPKTQEAGFSHCAIQANESCSWMMFTDVDEFVYSPTWVTSNTLSSPPLRSLIPKPGSEIGQIMMGCHEFGPSHRKSHPPMGVTQGYNCRRQSENRHKSIALLSAIDDSLLNVVHHFRLKRGYKVKKLGVHEGVVNHYKYQAWSEFKGKFRRRVSAYVVDWTQAVNLASKDRTPGLGNVPVEPVGWEGKFCEVVDDGLKELTKRWFSVGDEKSPNGFQMAWQR